MLPGLEIPLKYPKTAFVKDLAFKENKTHGICLFKLHSTLMLPGLEIPLKYPKTAFVKDLAFKEIFLSRSLLNKPLEKFRMPGFQSF